MDTQPTHDRRNAIWQALQDVAWKVRRHRDDIDVPPHLADHEAIARDLVRTLQYALTARNGDTT